MRLGGGGWASRLVHYVLLQMNGGHVVVYERDASQEFRNQGATLDLHHDSGLRALERAGLWNPKDGSRLTVQARGLSAAVK